jgi:DNA-binding IclR family transcriptional regulator
MRLGFYMSNEVASIGGGSEVPEVVPATAGTQTLLRGLDLLEAVTLGPMSLAELSKTLNLNRSTVHRLASALVDRGYLKLTPREGYTLSAKLLELGYAARQQISLPRVARPHLERLAELTGDTVHLGILDGNKALYLDKLPGRRRIEISSRVGERHPLCVTGLGKALLLDGTHDEWRSLFHAERGMGAQSASAFHTWLKGMQRYQADGYSFDLEENEDRIRCVGAPLRDETGKIVAAISVASVAQYMDDQRMTDLSSTVRETAAAISRDLGFTQKRPGLKA